MGVGRPFPSIERPRVTPTELYKAGRLGEAIDAQIAEVKARPADQARRLFLFELLAFAGELERATRQVDAIRYDDPEMSTAVASYRSLIDSEAARRRFFAEGMPLEILGEATESIRLRIEAAGLIRLGRGAEAAALLERANESTPPVVGKLNGKPFAELRDADDLFGGVLEVMARGKYFWIGLEQVVALGMLAPRHPRDLLYVPARLDLASESGEVFLPALYPGSYKHPDDQVRLGRATDWASTEGGTTLGVGARLFAVDDDAVGLLEWREYLGQGPSKVLG
jgi:type VI secretion system protein ImpE